MILFIFVFDNFEDICNGSIKDCSPAEIMSNCSMVSLTVFILVNLSGLGILTFPNLEAIKTNLFLF